MNKIFSIAAIAVIVALVTTISFAEERRSKIGIRAGFNLYDLTGEGSNDIDLGLGGGGGLVINIPINDFFSIGPEVSFFYRRLFNINYKDDSTKTKAYESELAISPALMLQVTPDKGPLYMATGVQFDIPLSPEVIRRVTYNGDTKKSTEKLDDRSKFDVGIVFGTGFYATSHLGIDLKCVIGLTDLIDEKDADGLSFNQYGIGLSYFF